MPVCCMGLPKTQDEYDREIVRKAARITGLTPEIAQAAADTGHVATARASRALRQFAELAKEDE